MDSAYGRLGLPFQQAVFVLATVISASREWAVADAGIKTMGMDHGNPHIARAKVWFCSDEHTTFSPPRRVGDRVRLVPGHVDPTMAYHERIYVCSATRSSTSGPSTCAAGRASPVPELWELLELPD